MMEAYNMQKVIDNRRVTPLQQPSYNPQRCSVARISSLQILSVVVNLTLLYSVVESRCKYVPWRLQRLSSLTTCKYRASNKFNAPRWYLHAEQVTDIAIHGLLLANRVFRVIYTDTVYAIIF